MAKFNSLVADWMRRTANVFAPADDALPTRVTRPMEKRYFTPSKSDYLASMDGMIENPDEVLSSFGTWDGIGFYDRMLRQFTTLYAACQQRIDRVPERKIVAGDPSNEASLAMARDAQRIWQLLPNRELIQRKLLHGMFYGFAAAEKVYGRDPGTGLLGPIKLYDQPSRNFKFDEEGNADFLGRLSLTHGETVSPSQMMFFRWGSSWTPYGEGELKFVYVATWMIQTILDFGLQALEELGRPLPVYHVPSGMDPEERNELENAVSKNHKFYVMVPTSDQKVSVEFPGISVTAGGAAGRAEFEAVRYLDGWIQRAILGTQQTQDRSGGSRALEEVRTSIVDDKTRQASDTLDACLTEQWLNDFGSLNWPNQPREMWPVFATDAEAGQTQSLNGIQASTAANLLLRLTAKHITASAAEQLITALGVTKTQANEMVSSTIDAADELVVAPEMMGAAQPNEGNDGTEAE